MKIFKTFLIVVMFVLSLTGCSKNNSDEVKVKVSYEDGSSASKQYFCGFALVYKKNLDDCVVPSLEEPEPVQPTITVQIASLKVIEVATARRGDGLVSLTRNTKKPLSVHDAVLLAKKYDRYDPKYNGANLYVGEQIILVRTIVGDREFFEWKMDMGTSVIKNK